MNERDTRKKKNDRQRKRQKQIDKQWEAGKQKETKAERHTNVFWRFNLVCLSTQKQPPEVFYKIGVFKNFAKFTWNSKFTCARACQSQPATLLKKRLSQRCFPVNFAKFLRTPFYRTPPVAASSLVIDA